MSRTLPPLPPLLAVLLLALLPLAPAPNDAEAKPPSYRVIARTPEWGRIEGTCRLTQAVEVPTVIFGCEKKRELPSPRVVFDAPRLGLADCVVSIVAIDAGKAWPVSMRLAGREAVAGTTDEGYVPHVQWVRAGTQLAWFNDSGFEDNVHGYREDGRTQANFLSPKGSRQEPSGLFLAKPGVFSFRADICTGASSFVHVSEHPYVFGPTTRSGRYELTEVPPGQYVVRCRHAGMGHDAVRGEDGRITGYRYDPPIERRKTVTVEPGGVVQVDFEIPAPE